MLRAASNTVLTVRLASRVGRYSKLGTMKRLLLSRTLVVVSQSNRARPRHAFIHVESGLSKLQLLTLQFPKYKAKS